MSNRCCHAELHPHLEFLNLVVCTILSPRMACLMTFLLPKPPQTLNCRCITFFLPIVLALNSHWKICECFACMHTYASHVFLVLSVVGWWPQNSRTNELMVTYELMVTHGYLCKHWPSETLLAGAATVLHGLAQLYVIYLSIFISIILSSVHCIIV